MQQRATKHSSITMAVYCSLIAGLLFSGSAPVHADNGKASTVSTLNRVEAAFKIGDFKGARALGQSVTGSNKADARSIACKSGLVIGGFLETGEEVVSSLHQALDDCRVALKEDPSHFDARFNYAVALGFEARRTTSAKHAIRSRDHINYLLSQNLSSPLALGAMAGWHSETASEGFLARTFLGASRKRARKYFTTATLRSDDIALRYERLRFLAAGNKKDRFSAIRLADKLMKEKENLTATNQEIDALDEILLTKTSTIYVALKTGEKTKVRAALKATAAFKNIENLKKVASRYPIPTAFNAKNLTLAPDE